MGKIVATGVIRGLMAILVFSGAESRADEETADPNFHIFLLVGQSNMAGRGRVGAEDRQEHPRILMLNRAEEWVPAAEPLHFDKPVAGTGPGLSFARAVAEQNPGITIGLVPCAVGGSPISAWTPEAYYKPTKSHPWDDATRRTRVALKRGTLKGILWHQGESDSRDGASDMYAGRLKDLISRFRDEFGDPHVPFLVGQLGQFEERPWNEHRERVNAAHAAVPGLVKHAAFVSSDGLDHKGDEVHFSAAGARELGRRYAAAYHELTAEAAAESK